MSAALINVLFAVIWMVVTGAYSLPNFALGFAMGALTLFLMREQLGADRYFRRVRRTMSLIRLFIKELIMSAVRVAVLVLKRDMGLKPGIFAYQTELRSDAEITLLANMITLTPGTLTVDVSDDRRTLFIHAVDCSDPEAARADIRNGFERKIREAFEQ
ncbi:MAG: Na+/H+ antiporter subunit E [Phyllobacteriaceae bacterium]|nr:Na+/H+ antiporter subunit E [Phyllobacteriaceae bacterium]